MPDFVIVFDLETVPCWPTVARINGLDETDEDGCREALGEKFPKHIFHKVCAIAALVAERTPEGLEVRSLGAPHIGERTEAELLQGFVNRIDDLRPHLISFNGASFDLPVVRYRCLVHSISAPGLDRRNYFHRYGESHTDLCDLLSCFSSQGKLSLDALCCALAFPSPKADGMDGSKVAEYIGSGRIAEVAAYAEGDVIATYRVWLRYQLFCGRLTRDAYEASEANLLEFVRDRIAVKPHLAYLADGVKGPSPPLDVAPTDSGLSALTPLML
jgi:3'-5' exonuclease